MSLLPPLAQLTPKDRGGAVVAVAYALIVNTILFSIIRVLTTFALKRKFGWDDALLILAVTLGLVQSILTEKSAVVGLGKHFEQLSPHQLDRYYKFSYASNILSIFAQAAAKCSVIHLMSRLSASLSGMQKIYLLSHGVVLAWLVFSVFSLAFQCDMPRPWVYTPTRCIGSGALWYPVLIFNIITDLALSFLFAPTTWNLQMPLAQRLTVTSLFAVRIVVCAMTIAQLVTLAPALTADDLTRALVVPVILGECVMNLSILASAVPSLHRFLNELHSQGFASAIPTTQYELSQQSNKDSQPWSKVSSVLRKQGSKDRTIHGRCPPKRPEFRPDADRAHSAITHEPTIRKEEGSIQSGDGSEDMIIRQTKAWDVHYDDRVQPRDVIPRSSDQRDVL